MCDLMDCKDCRHLCKNEINDYDVEKLWEEFEDVLFIEDENSDDSCSLVSSDDWQGWNKGTTRDTIWHWFDEHHSKGIHWLLYGIEPEERMVDNMEIKGMNGATKFVDWLLEMGYLDKEDIATDGVDIAMDMNKVKEVVPKFYNMLMCMCDCEERA